MIKVKHVLKDGTEVENIDGHLIKAEEFKTLYEIISQINGREGDQKKDEVV